MAQNFTLYELVNRKHKIESDFIKQFLGHEPSLEERRRFTIRHRLNEVDIFFKGNLVGRLRYYLKEGTLFVEYL